MNIFRISDFDKTCVSLLCLSECFVLFSRHELWHGLVERSYQYEHYNEQSTWNHGSNQTGQQKCTSQDKRYRKYSMGWEKSYGSDRRLFGITDSTSLVCELKWRKQTSQLVRQQLGTRIDLQKKEILKIFVDVDYLNVCWSHWFCASVFWTGDFVFGLVASQDFINVYQFHLFDSSNTFQKSDSRDFRHKTFYV